jgi:hypothetical protein
MHFLVWDKLAEWFMPLPKDTLRGPAFKVDDVDFWAKRPLPMTGATDSKTTETITET